MFAIRTEDGRIFASCDEDTYNEEITYTTREDAEKALDSYELTLPKGVLHIVEI